jgi:hypothetical protein
MTTKITATFNDGDESTVRTLTLPHDVSDRVGELIGLGLLAEVDSPRVLHDWFPMEASRAQVRVDRSGTLRDAEDYRIGDTVEVLPLAPLPAGTRGSVLEIDPDDSLAPIRIAYAGGTHWMQLHEIRRGVCAASTDYQIGDTVDVSPSAAWATGGRGTVVAIDELGGNFTQVCVENGEGERWWVSSGSMTRVESIWSAPTIAPDGTKTFTAPGMTMVEHPPTTEDGFPTWTITADAPAPEPTIGNTSVKLHPHDLAGCDDRPYDGQQPEKVAPELPLHSTREGRARRRVT